MFPKTVSLITKPSVTSLTLSPGKYKFECWGAQGGTGLTNGVKKYEGGRGAYTSGIVSLDKKKTFYLFVGGKGEDGIYPGSTVAKGGFNGGGNGGIDGDNDDSGAGGGSSDIRLVYGEWNNSESIKSRIMVAAGGSGSVYNSFGAPGGDLNGYNVTEFSKESYEYSTTNQTNGYKLGIGENGKDNTCAPSSGAGGGYYGGLSPFGRCGNDYLSVSSSGSSFVSGYEGCDASGENLITFGDPKIISGKDFFYSPFHKREKGHAGDGSILISSLDCFIKHPTCRRRNNHLSPTFLYEL